MKAKFVTLFLALVCSAHIGLAQKQKDLVQTHESDLHGKAYTGVHALLIGVNAYPNLPRNLQLAHAVDDATSLRKVLIDQYGFTDVTILRDGVATLAAIRAALSSFADNARVKPDDLVLVYFSGHGQTVPVAGGGSMGFLIPSDAKVDLANPTNSAPYLDTCLPMKQVWDYLDLSPAKHALVIADACFGGLLARGRGLGLSKATMDVMLARRARQVMTAGNSGQETMERDDLGHGVFTAKLIDELKARAVGQPFTVTDLFATLQDQVTNATNGKQTPQLGSFDSEGEVIFLPRALETGGSGSGDPGTTTKTKEGEHKDASAKSGAAGAKESVPAGLSRSQSQIYARLRNLLADADNRFANLPRRGNRSVTKPEGPVDVKVYPLEKGLPGLDGWVTDASDSHTYLYFEGTPTNGAQVFEDYKAAIRAVMPGGREQHFEDTNWRIGDGNFRITLQRDTKQPRHPEQVFQSFVLTILKIK